MVENSIYISEINREQKFIEQNCKQEKSIENLGNDTDKGHANDKKKTRESETMRKNCKLKRKMQKKRLEDLN